MNLYDNTVKPLEIFCKPHEFWTYTDLIKVNL